MWAMLLDWIISVYEDLYLKWESFYISLSLIDWFFSRIPNVPRSQIQLVGAAAIFLAQKFEELNPKKLDQFLYWCDSAYTKQEVLEMEWMMLDLFEYYVLDDTYDFLLNKLGDEWENFWSTKSLPQRKTLFRICDMDEPSFSLYIKSFSQITSVLDTLVLDFQVLQYPKDIVCLSILY